MFKRFRECEHEYHTVGKFYKEYLTEYKNSFDSIKAYVKRECKKCSCTTDVLLSSEEFVPELYHGRDERKEEYIKHLTDLGFTSEIDCIF